jgi:signal transduction histidine kinase
VLVHQARLAAMGEMIGHIAHQWRQPLNGLGLVLANLRDGWAQRALDDDAFSDLTHEAQRLIRQMSGTIADFSEFFRPDKRPEPFSVREQAAQTLALVEASFRHQGIHAELEPGDDVTLRGYPREYAQVLLNLLSNARDAILDAGRSQGRVAIRVERVDGRCRLTVVDDGPGITVDPVERIFEPYFSTKAGGTGLGLYMSQRILGRGMGGTIECRNLPVGAEFTIVTTTAEHAHDC